MKKPVVAVVGRPNVGKSTFFNHIVGRRVSIVDDKPGVTRDRIYATAEWCGRTFDLVDTGGIEPVTDDELLIHMREQAQTAIAMADVILFLTDLRSGVQAADMAIADMLRRSSKPVVVAVNKADTPGELPVAAYEFYNLGLGEIFAISAVHGLGIGDLLDALVAHFPAYEEEGEERPPIRLAIVGRPNVGKSSLVNALTGEARAIVTNMAGTTRDATDTRLTTELGSFVLVDTAGMRRKSRVKDNVEHYSVVRGVAAIERADVCILVISATEGVSEQDTKIAGLAHNEGKAVIIAVNKWDTVTKGTSKRDDFVYQIRERLAFMDYAPILFISAKTGLRVDDVLVAAKSAYEMATLRVPTGVLNEVIGEAQLMQPAPSYKGRRLKIRYASQPAVQPPTFVLFVNDTDLLHFSYERYLENQLRRRFDFTGTPIRLILRGPKKDQE